MDKEKFNKLFYCLCKSKGRDMDEFTCDLWYKELKDYQFAALIKGFEIYARDTGTESRLILSKMIAIIKPEIKEPLALPRPPLTVEERQKVLDRLQGIITMLADSKDIENLDSALVKDERK